MHSMEVSFACRGINDWELRMFSSEVHKCEIKLNLFRILHSQTLNYCKQGKELRTSGYGCPRNKMNFIITFLDLSVTWEFSCLFCGTNAWLYKQRSIWMLTQRVPADLRAWDVWQLRSHRCWEHIQIALSVCLSVCLYKYKSRIC